MKKITLLFLFGMSLLIACQPAPGPDPASQPPAPAQTSTPTPPESGPPLNQPEPTPSESANPTHLTPDTSHLTPLYILDTFINYDAKTVSVTQSIDYANNTGVALDDIVLAVVPNLWTGVFRLESLTIHELLEPEYELDGQRLTIQLPDPLPPNASIRIDIDYTLNPPAHNPNPDPNLVRPDIFGYTANQMNLVDWYPFIVPYDDGWLLNRPWFYGEHLVYNLADIEVTLTFSDAARAPVVASSGAVTQTDGIATTYRLNAGRTFALSMSREYQVANAEIDGIQVNSYYLPFFETGGKASLNATLDAIETYTRLFGPYQHESLAVVQGQFDDSMEFDGLYFHSYSFYNLYDGTERNQLVTIAAHETCHMWWFGAVANDQANHPWLDESLATYCELLFYEDHYPDAVNWWWEYRITFHNPQGKIDNPVSTYGGFTPYTNATYRRGALFLHDLRERMGDEAFFAFLQDYYIQMTGKRATPDDFFRILAEHNATDISDLLSEYFSQQP
jgi:hypothetical protein